MKTVRSLATPLLAPVLLAPVLLLALTGCAEDTRSAADAPAPAAATTTAPEPLPLTSHVLTDLAGFEASEPQLLDVPAFAEEHGKTVAELEEAGMVAAAATLFDPASGPGTARSSAQQFDEPGRADAEAARLFAANAEPEKGTTVSALQVPGIPGAQAVTLAASQGGKDLAAVEIVFVTDAVVHEVFAFSTADGLDVEAVVASATALYEGVEGRPVA